MEGVDDICHMANVAVRGLIKPISIKTVQCSIHEEGAEKSEKHAEEREKRLARSLRLKEPDDPNM